MDALTGIIWVIIAAFLFGSQFVPAKFCPRFKSSSYNLSMAYGILAGSIGAFFILGIGGITRDLILISMVGGAVWVTGNYLLIIGVAKAGMARAFCIVNFSAIISFFAGGVFLGELTDVTPTRIAIMLGAVTLVIVGSLLVTTTTPSKSGKGSDRSEMMRGMLLSFIATTFFSIYNVIIAYVVNKAGTDPGPTFLALAPGIVIGALIIAAVSKEKGIRSWRAAPSKWHLLAIVQGFIWAAAMVCIMFGWQGVGIAIGTPVQVGTQTIISSIWGILMFHEFRGLRDKSKAYGRYLAGAILTIMGIATIAIA